MRLHMKLLTFEGVAPMQYEANLYPLAVTITKHFLGMQEATHENAHFISRDEFLRNTCLQAMLVGQGYMMH